MIKIVEEVRNIFVYYNDLLVISHTEKKPALFIGYGEETIDSYRGNYKIEDYVESRLPLTFIEANDDVLTFQANDEVVKLHLSIKDNRLHGVFDYKGEANRFWIRFYAESEEKVYGCGEQASYFNLRKRNYPLWTSEPGVGRDKSTLTTFYADLEDKAGGDYYTTYYPEPTFVSTRKYWLHVDSYAYADFNFKHDTFHELHFYEIPASFVLSQAETYLDLVEDLTDFTGRLPELPEYLMDGIILGVQGGTKQVLDYLALAQKHDIKVSGLWCQDWAGVNHTSFGKRLFWNWQWNQTLYPELDKVIKDLNKDNVHFLSYICPFLLENESLFNEANKKGYLALNQQGKPYKEDFGEFYCGIVDLTNEEAFEWYKGIIKKNLIELGVEGWMADFGEYLPVDAVLSNGVDAKKMHNAWPVLWARCNYEAVKESGKLGEVFYFMRAGGHGSQRYSTSMWAGDQSVNWETHDGIASVIPSALSTGIIGNPFTHSDIGGYTSLHGNIRTKELFDRWCEMNVFTSYMRTHEGNRPSENFQFYQNEDTMKHMARMTSIRVMLKPYIKQLIKEASEKGYPVQRPLFMHYEKDPLAYDLQYEYLFGEDLYVKPVVKEHQETQSVYLPDDEWVHLFSGKIYQSGHHVVKAPIGYPPVFYKKSSSFNHVFEAITKRYGLS